MKEESRIEALENELKILKNEIQATLLEIREQILNHYYPELRAEEPMRSPSLPVRPQVGRPGLPAKAAPRTNEVTSTLSQLAAKGQIEPFSDIFLEDLSDEEGEEQDDGNHALINSRRPSTATFIDDDVNDDLDDAELEAGLEIDLQDFIDDDGFAQDLGDASDSRNASIKPIPSQPTNMTQPNVTQTSINSVSAAPRNTANIAPRTREVNFRQLKQAAAASAPKATPIPAPSIMAASSETPAPKANKQTLAALAAWVTESVEKVGKKRTNQIVETYATGGKLTRETQSSLVQLISLADEEEPAAPVGSREMLPLMVALDEILG